MLQWLRDNIKSLSWTLWLVIIAFVAFYIPDLLNSGGVSPSALAAVGSEQVSMQEFRQAHEALVNNYRQMFGDRFNPEVERQLQLPQQALQQVVAQKVLVAEAKRLGLAVTDRELQQAILDFGFGDGSGGFVGEEVYNRAVRRMGFGSPAEFEAALRQELLVGKLQEVLAANLFIPDREVERAYREQVEEARIRYLELPAARFAAEVTLGDDELAAYYQTHQEQYRRPERRVASYLVADQFRLRGGIEVPEADLAAYYEEHADEFTVAEQVRARHILLRVNDQRSDEEARTRLEQIRRRIEAGEDFGVIAREVSEDPGSRDQGGGLGFFGRGQMVPEFEEAAFGGQPGELVGPVRSSHGQHLIEVQDRRAGGARPFEEVASQIRFRLQSERAAAAAEARIQELARRIRDDGITTDEGLRSLAEGDEGVAFETTAPFARGEALPGIGRAPELNEAAFSLEVGGLSEPVKVPRGWVILRLVEVQEPRVPPLPEVEAEVRQALSRDKQQRLALERLAQARERVEGGEPFDQVAADLGLEVAESDPFGHGEAISGLSASEAVSEAALSLAEGEVGGPMPSPQGGILFQVIERQHWDPAEFERQREETRQGLEQQELNRILSAFIEERRNRPDVSYNRPLLESLGILGGQAEV